ncbi:MAG: FAD-binding protein [Deltaproteobacteria bacterium]|nr:FAD-binding protein [Deltaproteobacteria bacterium]
MKKIHLSGLELSLDEGEEDLATKAARAIGVSESDIISLAVVRKALDARRNKPPHFVYAAEISLAGEAKLPDTLPDGMQIRFSAEETANKPELDTVRGMSPERLPVVVIGTGPAGLFAAYTLALKGVSVLLLERGRPIERRIKDVRNFWEKGVLDGESNVLFGEGGAGTFSDGKLTSRTKNPYAGWVKRVLVEMGAPPSILTEAKPHIGTDRLREVIVRMRGKLMELGCIVQFENKVSDFVIRQGKISAVIVNAANEIRTDKVILALGQSADDTYEKLLDRGVKMEPKPFAMGLRIEHPQALINAIQYGRWSNHAALPPAEYFVTAKVPEQDRSVYTFCMCPGGQVIGCSAMPGSVITNGMSNSRRDGEFANSAVVATIRVEDFVKEGGPLCGLVFRRHWESRAFEAGGGNYYAPVQRLSEFIERKSTGVVGRTSFLPGVKASLLCEVLPDFVAEALLSGLLQIDKKMPGFISREAHLIGVETRTSSPVRICRGDDGQSVNVRGLFPCGEGAGYAGGIISSALDGIKAAMGVTAVIGGRQ